MYFGSHRLVSIYRSHVFAIFIRLAQRQLDKQGPIDMPEIKQTGRADSHSQTTLLANGGRDGIPLVTGAAFSIFSLPIQTQEAILAAATDLIVSRGGSQHFAPSPNLAPPPANAIHLAKETHQVSPQRMVNIAQSGHQLRKSVQSIRESLTKLESKVHDQIFDHERLIHATKSASLRAQPSAPIAKTPPSASPSRKAASSSQALLRSRNEPSIRRLDAAHTRKASPVVPSAQIQSAELRTDDREQATGPKIWRRWVRLDRVLESQASRWQSQASRLGVIVHFRFDAPTGQEIWTDVDIVLHIVDQFVASMIGRGKREARLPFKLAFIPKMSIGCKLLCVASAPNRFRHKSHSWEILPSSPSQENSRRCLVVFSINTLDRNKGSV